jgi:hypothetical protein
MTMIRVKQETLEEIFEGAEGQADALIAIYKLVLPEWDDIERLDGWPSVNETLWSDSLTPPLAARYNDRLPSTTAFHQPQRPFRATCRAGYPCGSGPFSTRE